MELGNVIVTKGTSFVLGKCVVNVNVGQIKVSSGPKVNLKFRKQKQGKYNSYISFERYVCELSVRSLQVPGVLRQSS